MAARGQNHITDSIFHSITGLSLGLSLQPDRLSLGLLV